MTTQPEIRASSRPENPPQDTTLQASLTEMTPKPDPVSSTFPLKSHPAADVQDGDTITVVTTQTSVDTQTTGSTSRDKAKPNTMAKEMVPGSAKEPHDFSLTENAPYSNSHSDILETMNQTRSTESNITTRTHSDYTLHPTQAHQPTSATKDSTIKDKKMLKTVETVISSPNTEPESPTAPSITSEILRGDAETASAEIASSDRSQDFDFATSSTVTSGSTTESDFVASSRYHSSEQEGVKEEKQEASPLLVTPAVSAPPLAISSVKVSKKTTEENVSLKGTAPQTNPAPNLTVITPTLQSGEALNNRPMVVKMGNLSAGEIKDKEEIEDRLEDVSPKMERTPQQQFPGEEKESGRETDEYELYLGVEEEVEGDTEMDKGSHDDDIEQYNQSSLDWMSQFSTVQSETESNQPPAYTVTYHGAQLRPGIRGQRVRLKKYAVEFESH